MNITVHITSNNFVCEYAFDSRSYTFSLFVSFRLSICVSFILVPFHRIVGIKLSMYLHCYMNKDSRLPTQSIRIKACLSLSIYLSISFALSFFFLRLHSLVVRMRPEFVIRSRTHRIRRVLVGFCGFFWWE